MAGEIFFDKNFELGPSFELKVPNWKNKSTKNYTTSYYFEEIGLLNVRKWVTK